MATQGAPGVLEEGEWSAELLPPTTAATKVPAGMWFPMSPFVGLNSSGGHSLRTKAQRTQPPRRRATTLSLAEEEEEGPPPSGHRRKEVTQVLLLCNFSVVGYASCVTLKFAFYFDEIPGT